MWIFLCGEKNPRIRGTLLEEALLVGQMRLPQEAFPRAEKGKR